MVSVGFSKVDQIEVVSFLSTKLPVSSSAAVEMPRLAVLDCHMTEPEPFTRRRLPLLRNWKEPVESTVAAGPPACQMGMRS